MKKGVKHKSTWVPAQDETDMAGIMDKMQQQMLILEKKIDILINKSSSVPVEVRSFPKPFHQPSHAHGNREQRQDNSFRERVLHKAICADCKKECEVPFKPSGGRPVYCKDCFSKRKSGSLREDRYGNRHRDASHAQAVHMDRPHSGERRKPAEKKRIPVKRRKGA